MGLINFTEVEDGNTAQANDVNTPFNTIYDEFNGNIDQNNLADGAVTAAKLATNSVSTVKMLDANVTPDKLGTGAAANLVATGESTTSTFPVDLATSGPAVTVTIGANGLALVSIYCHLYTSGETILAHMGFAVSGATTTAADLTQAITFGRTGGAAGNLGGASATGREGATFLVTGLTAGSTTFTAKYGEEGGGTAVFSNRRIAVVPL